MQGPKTTKPPEVSGVYTELCESQQWWTTIANHLNLQIMEYVFVLKRLLYATIFKAQSKALGVSEARPKWVTLFIC